MFHDDEIANHRTKKSCWIIIDANVYDVTSYLSQHPGGAAILLRQGGRDASEEFRKVHSHDVLQYLPKGSCLGTLKTRTDKSLIAAQKDLARVPPPTIQGRLHHISQCIILSDFEKVAKLVLPLNAWIYASTSANTGPSMESNLSSWGRVTFRPRVLRDVATISSSTSILGYDTPYPFFVAPMGSLGRAHAGAEKELMRGLAQRGVHGVISTESTVSWDDIAASLVGNQQQLLDSGISQSQLHFQLYIPTDHAVAVLRIRKAKTAGYKTLWLTVDTPMMGKRVADRRNKVNEALSMELEEEAEAAGLGALGNGVSASLSPSVTWLDLLWIKEEWEGPIVLKGVQCAEDAKLAMDHGCQGIVLSNHGGRQAYTSPNSLMTLLEIREYYPMVLEKMEVFVDGGLQNGADILKALCLGAKSVGIGRSFFFALAAYGSRGVEKCIDILADEMRLAMSLLGVTSLDQLSPDMVNASGLINEMWRPLRSRL